MFKSSIEKQIEERAKVYRRLGAITKYEAAWKAIRVALLTSKRRRSFEEIHSIIEMTEMEFEIGAVGDLIAAVKEDAE